MPFCKKSEEVSDKTRSRFHISPSPVVYVFFFGEFTFMLIHSVIIYKNLTFASLNQMIYV